MKECLICRNIGYANGKKVISPQEKGTAAPIEAAAVDDDGCDLTVTLITLPASIQPSVAQVSPGCGIPGNDGNGTLLTGVVNTYFPPSSSGTLSPGATQMQLGPFGSGSNTPVQTGDLLVIMQMQDAAINSTNTGAYGDGVANDPGSGASNLNSAGRYEYIVATNAVPLTGGTLQFQGTGSGNGLVNTHTQANFGTQGQRRYQVTRTPQYNEVSLAPGLTASAWNGSTGGVLALDASGQINFNGSTIDVSGRGFRGGGGRQLTGGTGGADTDYRNLATRNFHSPKAEGIAGTPQFLYDGSTALVNTGVEGYPEGSHWRGAPGNAGGGGSDGNIVSNDQNSGGGGGGNGGNGGRGGNAWNSQEPYGGFGGALFPGAAQQVVLGGGGGAGTRNNSTGIQSSGGRGGGIVLIRANRLTGTGTINANGTMGPAPANDGAGGGGAGGSIVVTTQAGGLSTLTTNTQGAAGADAWPTTTAELSRGHGSGGAAEVASCFTQPPIALPLSTFKVASTAPQPWDNFPSERSPVLGAKAAPLIRAIFQEPSLEPSVLHPRCCL
ncbi:hypothetical protein C1752_03321 [Acaryochloris thomasi RCC1774]|uniref:Uncharacterized protein n=1 Tax=Acaryochloris thomasi RCC1774 TaxID=1764569 RepID=A0A2W1JPB8_9CYAN|nr:hypothetical protein [Acaryochloris thomasi]PZD72732.1 hypothetical protein C1752_03321 [Acaryochloris thomasi RCC1774]